MSFSIQGISPTNVKFIGRNDTIVYTTPVDFIHGHYDSIIHIQPGTSFHFIFKISNHEVNERNLEFYG